MKKVKDEKRTWEYRGWRIEGQGGFTMVRHYNCFKGDLFFHTFKLSRAKQDIDNIENGQTAFDALLEYQRKPAYL